MSKFKASRLLRCASFVIMADLLSSILTLASAQASSSSSSAEGPYATPKVHVVAVGASGDFTYNPNVTIADVGDIVSFQFYPTNHSVVRGEYTNSTACGPSGCNPCVPYELIHADKAGFHSDNILTQVLPQNGQVACSSPSLTNGPLTAM
jgi:plastocyanin